MGKPSIDDIRLLLRELVFPFYALERDLSLPIQNHRNETDAEHSWSLALCALTLAPLLDKSLDPNKVASYAVIHDLVEVYAGDTSVWAEKELIETKSKREIAALKKLRERLPQFPHLSKLIESYEKKNSNEALFVYALDKFIAMLILYEDDGYYYKKGKRTKVMAKPVFEKHRQKAHAHPLVAKYYDQLIDLIDLHPDYFYSAKS